MAVQASRVRTTVNAPAASVWEALTTASTLKRFFFGADIVTDWKVGSPIRFRGEWRGKRYEDRGTIKEFDPPKRLSYTHWSAMSGTEDRPENYHVVTFELRPTGGGTEVELTQTNHDAGEPVTPEGRQELERNWTMVLDGLEQAVEA